MKRGLKPRFQNKHPKYPQTFANEIRLFMVPAKNLTCINRTDFESTSGFVPGETCSLWNNFPRIWLVSSSIVVGCMSIQTCIHTLYIYALIEGCLEVELPTIWTDEKQRWSGRKEKSRREKIREEKESEETRCRCAKKSRDALYFSHDLLPRRVAKQARYSGGCGAI